MPATFQRSHQHLFLMLTAVLMTVSGCSETTQPSAAPNAADGSLKLVATTGHIADALKRITAETNTSVKLLCGPGIDPHSFAASTGDVQAMADAQAIFFNGFHLEAKLHDLLHGEFSDKAWAMAEAFPEDARLDWVEDGEVDPEAPFDPHIWNHLPGWAECVSGLIEQLAAIDPDNADLYRRNGNDYVAEIQATHDLAGQKFAAIPKDQRVLVSAHDAFNYFARVYDFEPVAVLGVGNDAEADIKTMRQVAQAVCDKKVPVIFIETITNPKVTEALQEACAARDWTVTIADQPLYSDDLGSEPPVNTYLGAFMSNVELITASLK